MSDEKFLNIINQARELYINAEEEKRNDTLEDEKDVEEEINHLEQIDYIEQHKKQIEIGQKDEDYVYNYERKRLKGTPYYNKICKHKAANPKNGYDILYYERGGEPLYIEIKANPKIKKESTFKLSIHQMQTAQHM